MRDVFDEIANSEVTKRGTIMAAGKYLFTVKKVEIGEKTKGTFFILELLVRQSAAITEGIEPNSVGSTVSVLYKLEKNSPGLGNTKDFVCTLLGVDPKTVDPEEFKATLKKISGATQPARGMPIACETFTRPIKSGANAGKPFVGPGWKHVPWTQADIAANCAMLDDADRNPAAVAPAATPTPAAAPTGSLLARL